MGFTYNPSDKMWYADDVTDLTPTVINNLLVHKQPYSPYEAGFDQQLYDDTPYNYSPKVHVTQQSVMFNGYGKGVTANDFSVVLKTAGFVRRTS